LLDQAMAGRALSPAEAQAFEIAAREALNALGEKEASVRKSAA